MAQIGSMGSRGVPGTQREYSRQSATPQDFGAGVASALGTLGVSLNSYAQFEKQRRAQDEDNANNLAYERISGEAARTYQETLRNAPANGAGITNAMETQLRDLYSPWLESMSPEQRAIWAPRVEQAVQTGTTQAFEFEYTAANTAFTNDLTLRTEQARARIYEDPALLDQELAALQQSLDASTLSAAEKETVGLEILRALQGAVFLGETGAIIEDNTAVGDPSGPAPVIGGLTPGQSGLLGAIGSVESTGDDRYYRRNGTARVTDLTWHPGPDIPEGGTTSAFGAYQFIWSTWEEVTDLLAAEGRPVPDASPQSQDRVALRYAQMLWEQRSGSSIPFDQVVNGGDPALIGQLFNILRGPSRENAVWQGLWDMELSEFASAMTGGAQGYVSVPNAMEDPRFNALTFEQRLQLTQQAQQTQLQLGQQRVRQDLELQTNTANALHESFVTNQPGAYEAIQAALSNGSIREQSLRDGLRADVAEYEQVTAEHSRVSAVITGGGNFTNSEADQKAVMGYLQREGIVDGIRLGDAGAASRLMQVAQQTSYLPPEMISLIQSQLGSSTPGEAAFAAELMNRLYEDNPLLFGQYATTDQLAAAASLAGVMDGTGSVEEAVGAYRMLNSPEFKQTRELRQSLAEEQVAEMGQADVAAMLDPSMWPTGNAELPGLPEESFRLEEQFRTHFTQGFIITGTEAGAKAYANRRLRETWAPSPMGGELMEFSPLSMRAKVEELGGREEWIPAMVNETLEIGEGERAFLVADPMTAEEIARGVTPSYEVHVMIGEGPDAELVIPQDETGRPLRLPMTPLPWQRAQHETDVRTARIRSEIEALEGQRDAATRNTRPGAGAVPAWTPDHERALDILRRRLPVEMQPETLPPAPPPAPDPYAGITTGGAM